MLKLSQNNIGSLKKIYIFFINLNCTKNGIYLNFLFKINIFKYL